MQSVDYLNTSQLLRKINMFKWIDAIFERINVLYGGGLPNLDRWIKIMVLVVLVLLVFVLLGIIFPDAPRMPYH